MSRDIRAGEDIRLRVKFVDDLSVSTEATGVSIFVFDPTIDTFIPENATLSGSPTYFDNGIYEYTYSVPSVGPEGSWTDLWLGTLNGQTISGIMNFNVLVDGVINAFSDQLFPNNLVTVTVVSGIRALDGSILRDPIEFSFMTTTEPTYSDVRKVRLEYGAYVKNIEDDILQMAILEASIEAGQLTFSTLLNSKVFEHARREWVTCKSALTLLSNMGNLALKSKSLGDFSVTYDTNALRDMIQRAWDCLQKWEMQLMTGGYAKSVQQPLGVVKGELDVDRPQIGREWSGLDSNGARTPATNLKGRIPYMRRYKSFFTPLKKRYW